MNVPPSTHRSTTRSRALTERLRSTIAEYQHREPKVTEAEVAQALRDAMPAARGSAPSSKVALVAAVAGLVTALGMGLLMSSAASSGRDAPIVPLIALMVAGIGAVAALVARSRNDR